MLEDEDFLPIEREILSILFKSIRPMSTKEISDESEYAWETCINILELLASDKYVTCKEKMINNKKYRFWRFNYAKQREIKERLRKR